MSYFFGNPDDPNEADSRIPFTRDGARFPITDREEIHIPMPDGWLRREDLPARAGTVHGGEFTLMLRYWIVRNRQWWGDYIIHHPDHGAMAMTSDLGPFESKEELLETLEPLAAHAARSLINNPEAW